MPHRSLLPKAGAVALILIVPLSVMAGDLRGVTILNTGPFACDGTLRSSTSRNSTGSVIYIKKAQLWHGIEPSKQAERSSAVYRNSDNAVLILFPQDAYANPRGITHVVSDFAPDYFTLSPGDQLRTDYNCTAISGAPFNAAVAASVWYTIGAP